MNLDTFTGHQKLTDSYRKALTFFVYPFIAVFSLCLVFFYYCAFKAAMALGSALNCLLVRWCPIIN